jgi:thiamine kinase-like enzyme
VLNRLKKDPFFDGKEIRAITPMLQQGFCNINYTLKTPKKTYHLREFKQQANRVLEFQIQRKVHTLMLAPKAYYMTNAYMVCDYVKGVHKTTLSLGVLRRLALLLRKLHREKIKQKPMVIEKQFQKKDAKVQKALKVLKSKPTEWVLSHNDLNPKNILFRGVKVTLIDWEFAGMNDRYFDVASLLVEFKVTPLQERHFLQYYFQNQKVDKEKLKAYKLLYDALCKEWFEAMAP